MAMRADYSQAMTRRAGRVILSSVLVFDMSRPSTPTFGHSEAHRTDLGPNIGLHFSGVWRGSTRCRMQWGATCWCSYYQAATILAIRH
jgi:hypothetical protein